MEGQQQARVESLVFVQDQSGAWVVDGALDGGQLPHRGERHPPIVRGVGKRGTREKRRVLGLVVARELRMIANLKSGAKIWLYEMRPGQIVLELGRFIVPL